MPVDYLNPTEECDVIMKGGITSGIVYPKTVLSLAENYRFRSVGGASAGAIAAAITAAAEYGRANKGFKTIEAIPDEMGKGLAELFQPWPDARVMFGLFYDGWLRGKWPVAVGRAVLAHLPLVIGGLAIGVLLAGLAAGKGDGAGIVAGLVLGGVLAFAFLVTGFGLTSLRVLKARDFGLCPGRTQPYAGETQAISDWLAKTIERAAGRLTEGGELPEKPLTFGELWTGSPDGEGTADKPRIDLRMMTTNLSMKRPSVLPKLGDRDYYFRPSEFRELFPDWVVKAMCPEEKAVPGEADLFYFPDPADLPVVVATRMSLSFPFLFSAVPLYRKDRNTRDHVAVLTRILFSDGGISSNFPIHFFDGLLPRRPTFGVSLDDLEKWREEDEDEMKPPIPPLRARLPMKAGEGQWVVINPIKGVAGFAAAVVYAAKDWQDNLQSTLPGYRERIAHIYLNEREGGLNLAMPPSRIDALVGYGERAGGLLIGKTVVAGDHDFFDFADHRWRRFLVAFARIEETLSLAAEVWADNGFAAHIRETLPNPTSYMESSRAWRDAVFERMGALMQHVAPWRTAPLRTRPDGKIPKPDTDLRITPRAEQ